MSKFEILTVIFYCVIFGYLYFDYRYKEALGNAIHIIVQELKGENEK